MTTTAQDTLLLLEAAARFDAGAEADESTALLAYLASGDERWLPPARQGSSRLVSLLADAGDESADTPAAWLH
jgi:hypothetical protein